MALRRRGDQQQRPLGHPGDRPACRAWQVRPLVRGRRARHGARGPPIIPVPVRADHAHLGAERLDAAHRPRRHRVDQLRRALSRRANLRLHRPHHQGPGGLERGDELGGQGGAQLQPRSPHGARPALRGRSGVRRVVKGLWDCWEDGAIVANKATGVYIDPSKVRPLDHRGRFFQVKGPVNMARCPQGHPVIIQAGGSEAGLELAARTADVVFSVVQELSAARRAYRDLKGRMAKYGRTPDQITVLPGVMPIIGSTEAEARDKLSLLQSWLTPTNALTLVTSRIGYDLTGFPLDGPVPPPPPAASSQTFPRVPYETADRETMTILAM